MNIMADKAHYESHLEAYIVQKLQAQGWVIGQSKNYHTEYALYPEDLITWIQATQPEKWEIMEERYSLSFSINLFCLRTKISILLCSFFKKSTILFCSAMGG
jgi:hypothetical protein